MSHALELTPIEIRKAGWEALRKSLGVAGALKFIFQYEKAKETIQNSEKSCIRMQPLTISC